MNQFMMKTLEKEHLLHEHIQYHPPSIIPSTREERMLMTEEARNKALLLINHIIVRQIRSSSEI